jgi:hypothetical protein
MHSNAPPPQLSRQAVRKSSVQPPGVGPRTLLASPPLGSVRYTDPIIQMQTVKIQPPLPAIVFIFLILFPVLFAGLKNMARFEAVTWPCGCRNKMVSKSRSCFDSHHCSLFPWCFCLSDRSVASHPGARSQSHVKTCGISGGQICIRAGSLRVPWLLLPIILPFYVRFPSFTIKGRYSEPFMA